MADATVFVMVVTRSLSDPDKVERKRINYSRSTSRQWLAKHSFWCFMNGFSVTTFAVDGTPTLVG